MHDRFSVRGPTLGHASAANDDVLFIDLRGLEHWFETCVVKPVFALEALKHVELLLIDRFLIMWSLTMTVNVVIVVTILVQFVLIVFVVVELTAFEHVTVATVTAKVELRV